MFIFDRTSSQSTYPPCMVRSPSSLSPKPFLPWRTLKLSNTTHSPIEWNITEMFSLPWEIMYDAWRSLKLQQSFYPGQLIITNPEVMYSNWTTHDIYLNLICNAKYSRIIIYPLKVKLCRTVSRLPEQELSWRNLVLDCCNLFG